LRAVTPGDRAELARLLAESYAEPTFDDDPMPYERAQRISSWLATSWARDGFGAFVIALEDGTVIGSVGLRPADEVDDPTAVQIGYNLLPAYRGRGYMREAATAVIDAAIAAGFSSIHGYCSPSNVRSVSVMRAIGMLELHDGKDRHFVFSQDQGRNGERVLGEDAGLDFWIADDFDAPLVEFADYAE
jgi:ribosomal-protein-alanine N-acetyltransferase